jgi:hypothetical protein
MFDAFGWISWWGLAVIGIMALACIGLAVWMRMRGKPKAQPDEAVVPSGGRLGVLESTDVDERRQLLLVRCDDIEHLILVGGPADIVVESDVRRHRATARPPGKLALAEAASKQARPLRAAPKPATEPTAEDDEFDAAFAPPRLPAAAPPAAPTGNGKAAAANGRPEGEAAPAASIASEPRPAPAAFPSVARAEAAPAEPRPPGEARPSEERARRLEAKAARREAAGRGRNPAPSPAVAAAAPAQDNRVRLQPARPARPDAPPAVDRRAKPVRPGQDAAVARGTPRSELPPADVPWAQPDSLEGEIVRAIRVAPQPPLAPPATIRQPTREAPAVPRAANDRAATLGDLAERLEEALAREVRATDKADAVPEIDLDFGFGPDPDAITRAAPPAAPQPAERLDPPRGMAPAPEPEARREVRVAAERPDRAERQERPERPERQEETPVISLNARRREPVDPLEDEMARLLGELTGDTSRR